MRDPQKTTTSTTCFEIKTSFSSYFLRFIYTHIHCTCCCLCLCLPTFVLKCYIGWNSPQLLLLFLLLLFLYFRLLFLSNWWFCLAKLHWLDYGASTKQNINNTLTLILVDFVNCFCNFTAFQLTFKSHN